MLRRFFSSSAKPIECMAAIALAPKQPLSVERIRVDPPRRGEVRVRVVTAAICHTDAYTLSGGDSEGIFPSVLGHEAGAIVSDVGEGVKSVKVGDHVVPLYTPECGACVFCTAKGRRRTNLCNVVRATQGLGQMPDGTSRLTRVATGESLAHYMGVSGFAQYAVLPEIALSKVPKQANLAHAALFGCGVTTGYGAATTAAKVEKGSSVAVFGLGTVGLAAVMGARECGAAQIIAVDVNESKFEVARRLGATHTLNPRDGASDAPLPARIAALTAGNYGVDYAFEATGNTDVMAEALESTTRGWGTACIIGVAEAGKKVAFRPFFVITGRRLIGTAFGGVKGRSEVPRLVRRSMRGELPVADFVTDELPLARINDGFDLLHSGRCLRTLIHMWG